MKRQYIKVRLTEDMEGIKVYHQFNKNWELYNVEREEFLADKYLTKENKEYILTEVERLNKLISS